MSEDIPIWAVDLRETANQTRRDIRDLDDKVESQTRLLFGPDNDQTGLVGDVKGNTAMRQRLERIGWALLLMLIGSSVSGFGIAAVYLIRATGGDR